MPRRRSGQASRDARRGSLAEDIGAWILTLGPSRGRLGYIRWRETARTRGRGAVKLGLVLLAGLLLAGCRASPIPKDIDEYFHAAHQLYAQVNPVLQEGDIIFRRGHLRLLGGLVNYSQLLSWWAESPFAHAGIVLQKVDDTFVVVDSGPYGIKRVFLIDWLIAGPENVVVKRIRPTDRHKIPELLAAVRELVDRDVLHDDKYITGDDRFYCTEIVDHCFREIGLPLAPKIAMRDMPNIHRWDMRGLFELVGLLAGLDIGNEVAIAGNDEIGMYSSPVLVEVLNLLPEKYRHPPFALPRAEAKPADSP